MARAKKAVVPSAPVGPVFPDFTTVVAAGAAAKSKDLWKSQMAIFCTHYSAATGLAIGADDIKVGGCYHHAFKAWQAMQ
jgi:hypothetical protein